MNRTKTVTLKQISQYTGVGISTVSQVLNNRPVRCTPQTRKLIIETAKQLGYVPDIIGRSLRGKKTHTIGLIAPSLELELSELEHKCWQAGYCLYTAATHNDPKKQSEIITQFKQRRTDGLILFYPLPDSEVINTLIEEKYPFVIVDITIPYPQANTFYTDIKGSVRGAINYLYDLGHRRIAAIFSQSNFPHSILRMRGWKGALRDKGIEPDDNWYISLPQMEMHAYVYHSAYKAGKEFAKRFSKNDPTRPTAIYTAVDEVAIGVISALRDVGWDVPKDVSVIGMHALDVGQFAQVPITSVDVYHRRCRYQALEYLLDTLSEGAKQNIPVHRRFPFRIIERKSTAPPPF